MAMLSFGGIDVSKDRLDVMVLPEEQSSSVSNDAAGWAELVEQLRSSSIAAIGIEASGGYERAGRRLRVLRQGLGIGIGRVDEQRNDGGRRDQLVQQRQPLRRQLRVQQAHAGEVAARPA
jgi:hypothetical protein